MMNMPIRRPTLINDRLTSFKITFTVDTFSPFDSNNIFACIPELYISLPIIMANIPGTTPIIVEKKP